MVKRLVTSCGSEICRWTVDRPEIRVDPIPILPLQLEGARIQRERITKEDIDEFGATVGCPGCSAIKDNTRAQAQSNRCRVRLEGCLRITPQGAERLERRNEVINEALGTDEKREVTILLQHEIREQVRLNPTRIPREECSGSQRRQQPAAVDGDPLDMGIGESTKMPRAPSANTRRRIVVQ